MTNTPTQLDDLPPIMTPKEVAALLQIGRTRIYELCRVSGFPAICLGTTFRIPKDRLLEWLHNGGLDQAAPLTRPRRRR